MKHGVAAPGARDVQPACWAASTAGVMVLISSSPNSPPSPAWGFKPAHGDAGAGQAQIPAGLRGQFDGEGQLSGVSRSETV